MTIQRTPEQYLRRAIVQVATATGRSPVAVAAEPLAVVLWTWAELRALDEEARVQRLGERVDAAGMMALAFHEPKKLASQERRYLREAGLLGPMLDQAKARTLATVERAKRAQVVRSAPGR